MDNGGMNEHSLVSRYVVLMGVSGSGKSSVGEKLSPLVGLPYRDGDDMHPQSNIDKMESGTPLNDEDRMPWLKNIGQELAASGGLMIGCSALKRSYRDLIRSYCPEAVFVHLAGDFELLSERMNSRTGHFMPASLLKSQFETLQQLEPDEKGVVIDIEPSVGEVAQQAANYLEGSPTE
ncbi:gluconokinase [Corynebacterium casei]|uniref:gluconokinase n=1 Tax=Corynebacterium casei TaxID=160386 RepID=UPI003FD193BA